MSKEIDLSKIDLETLKKILKRKEEEEKPKLEKKEKPIGKKGKFQPSSYQQAIFNEIEKLIKVEGRQSILIKACAGSGKTKTIEKGINFIPDYYSIAACAFNQHNAFDLARKIKRPNVTFKTLHQLAAAAVGFHLGSYTVKKEKVKNIVKSLLPNPGTNDRLEYAKYKHTLYSITKIIALIKATVTDYKDQEKVRLLTYKYGIWLDAPTLELALNLIPMAMEINNKTIEKTKRGYKEIDFDDMLYLAVRFGLWPRKFDWLCVDEAQDLNAAQMFFIKMSLKKDSKVIFVGDENQSIYQWRGADVQSIQSIQNLFKPSIFPLSITYRCPKEIVKLAQQYVPEIEAGPDAIDGEIIYIEADDFLSYIKPNDMFISRYNAPLMHYCLKVLKTGTKATIKGKDIGENLEIFIESFNQSKVVNLLAAMKSYVDQEKERVDILDEEDIFDAFIILNDQYLTIKELSEGMVYTSDLIERLKSIFVDQTEGIVFSTIHRAKGLETDNIFFLDFDIDPRLNKESWKYKQEINLKYVAITRAKEKLYILRFIKENLIEE